MIVLINPNSTVSMTEAMVETARDEVPGVPFEGWTSSAGPVSIQGAEDGAAAVPPMLELVQKACAKDACAIIIGCFDDTGLDEARAIADCPVIGIGQAAYHFAALHGGRFSVVTTLAVSVPILQENIKAYGLDGACAKVRASGVPVLPLEADPDRARAEVLAAVQRAEAEAGITSVALGCGGMVHLPALIRANTGLYPIDGVRAAAAVCGSIFRASLG